MNLSDLPLFSNTKNKIEHDYDFTKVLDFKDVNVSFTLSRESIDGFISFCEDNEIDINIGLTKIITHYLKSR